MSGLLPPPEDPTQTAVSLFWTNRRNQMANLADGGLAGGGARSGGHMSGIKQLVADIFKDEMPEAEIDSQMSVLPGYYRASKDWDLVVRYKNCLVAVLEFKSQVGSVGNNGNNRIEEAIGNSVDLWTMQKRNETYGPLPPWLAYVLVLQETAQTERPVRTRKKPIYPVDSAFVNSSYSERYQIMLGRFITDGIYNAGWYITTKVDDEGGVTYNEPLSVAASKSFRAAVRGRVDFVRSVLD